MYIWDKRKSWFDLFLPQMSTGHSPRNYRHTFSSQTQLNSSTRSQHESEWVTATSCNTRIWSRLKLEINPVYCVSIECTGEVFQSNRRLEISEHSEACVCFCVPLSAVSCSWAIICFFKELLCEWGRKSH